MYQKTAAEHFAEAITRLSKQPHPFAPPEAEALPPQGSAGTSLHNRVQSRGGLRRNHGGARGLQALELADL